MANQIIQSIKTIAQSLVDNAGYDKTRGGFIVGVNSVTNTYSVKVDGVTYPIVRAVDDATYNIGDVVKVVIPCNQATQMYISSSILSDNSLGNKIANATTLAEDAGKLGLDNQLDIKKVSDVANSKNKTFRQDTAPTEGMSSGDVWIDTSDNNTLYVYDGTQWVFSGGGNGQDGLNNATILLYKRGATAPEKPTAEVTYTFADASLSPTDVSLSLISALNGWTQAIPQVDGNPCWVIAATASATTATDTIGVSEWSTQIKFVEDGVQGLNQATIFLYSRTTSTKPSSPATYTFASGMLSPLPTDWSRSVPTNNGDPCYVTTAIAIGRGSNVTITSDAWSDPTVLVENGAEGYSPTVSTGTSSDGSTTITVTNKDGSSTTELVDGTARKDAADAATSATDYISPQSVSSADDGIKVFPKSEKNNPKNYININSSSTDIYKNGKKIAQYSQGIIINDDDGNKVFSAELMNGKSINEHLSSLIHKEISAGVTTTLSFDLIVAPSGDIEGNIPVSNSSGGLLGTMHVYSFIEAPQELSIPSEYGTGSVLVNSISYTNRTVTVSITNNTNIEIDFGTSAENADHMIWSYYMRDYGVATRCGGFWENDYTKAFAIGVGEDANNRKNAFAVDWDGNTIMQGELAFGTAASVAATIANLGVADYIVEQGTSGIWKYRKWNSGVAECFGYISLGSMSVSAAGNVYRGNKSVSLPSIFNDIPSNVHITNGDPLVHIISINGRATDANTVLAYVWKSTSGAVDVNASFHVIGTWK